MRVSAPVLALGIFLQSVSMAIPAAIINTTDLPTDIQTCISSGYCLMPNEGGVITSSDDHNGASLFLYRDFSGLSFQQKFLMRYTLTDSYQAFGYGVTPLSGYVWLQGNTTYYKASATHDFTLYLDQVTPLPYSILGAVSGSVISLGLSSADLLGGGAFWSFNASEEEGYVPHESGTLITDGVTTEEAACLAGTCTASAVFNTVFLDFVDSGGQALDLLPTLDTTDGRAVLYQQGTGYSSIYGGSGSTKQVYSVQAVPLPGAVGLFLSGLLLMPWRRARGIPRARIFPRSAEHQ